MLSHILKPLQKITRNKISGVELPSELKMTLSFVESGCLTFLLNNKTAFIFKSSQSEIELLREIKEILFGFECIKRPEFPSVRMYFELRDRANEPYRFDYFFGIESDEEMELLRSLKDQCYFDILFFDSAIRYSKRVNITKEEKKKIEAVLDEVVD